MSFPVGLCAGLALAGCAIASTAAALEEWTETLAVGATSRVMWGLFDFGSDHYCQGWIVATISMIIATAVFFFFVFLACVAVVASKTPTKTKGLRLGVFALALLTFALSLLSWIFWICFNEWPVCWTNGDRSVSVHSLYSSIRYGASWILATIACGFALLMCLAAALAVAKTPIAGARDEYHTDLEPPPPPPPPESTAATEIVSTPTYPTYPVVRLSAANFGAPPPPLSSTTGFAAQPPPMAPATSYAPAMSPLAPVYSVAPAPPVLSSAPITYAAGAAPVAAPAPPPVYSVEFPPVQLPPVTTTTTTTYPAGWCPVYTAPANFL